jgi:hypothetical protein
MNGWTQMPPMMPSSQISIPVVDVRDGGPVRYAIEGRLRARALRDDCMAWFPRIMRAFLPLLDVLTRRWLERTSSPYLIEIKTIADALAFSGVWFLNGSYGWCCTALAHDEGGAPWLARTLDWPFPGLGRRAEVARMKGPAGDYWSVTWPGYVGVLTAMAPGRFAVALNQAPLWRRTQHPWLRPYDIAINAISTWMHARHMLPEQLLREVCETCRTFAQARERLASVAVARPAIYILAGCTAGERCVIERTEEEGATRFVDTVAANDWLHPRSPWEARIGGPLTLVATTAEAAENSRLRRESLADRRGHLMRGSFGWVTPPVLNPCTRIAVEMCPATATLRVVGYEIMPGADLPQPVTERCEVAMGLAT